LRNHITQRTENNVTQRVSKYQLISQPKLDKFQLQCYSKRSKQMFKVTATRFHTAMQTFAPLIDSAVDHCC